MYEAFKKYRWGLYFTESTFTTGQGAKRGNWTLNIINLQIPNQLSVIVNITNNRKSLYKITFFLFELKTSTISFDLVFNSFIFDQTFLVA